MRSHFSLPRRVTAACAVAGATTLLNGNCTAQTFIAADYATNSIYASGWSAGQNGGYGFGPWNFDYTGGGSGQEMSSSSPIGTGWTLFNVNNHGGISVVGRAITEPGGLQVGQTLRTVIENPTGYSYYRGFDILFYNVADNEEGGDNAAALRLLVFNYFNGPIYGSTPDWVVVDGNPYGSTTTSLTTTNTAAAGLQFDLTLTSPTNYLLTMTPLNGTTPYTLAGPLAETGSINYTNSSWPNFLVTNLPISYVNYRLWNTASSGPNDTANNFAISSMMIFGMTLNIQLAGGNAVLSWTTNVPGFNLASTTNLTSPVWSTNLPPPVVVNGQNVVTNPITGRQQYFRLQE